MIKLEKTLVIFGLMACSHQWIHAQQSVDPSIVNPEVRSRLIPPKDSPNFFIEPKAPKEYKKPSGERFSLNGINFIGNSVFSSQELNYVIQKQVGQLIDFSELQTLVDLVSEYYLAAGYPFARVYILPQEVVDGVVDFTIREGRFGDLVATVGITSEFLPNSDAQAYLSNFRRGDIITSSGVERVGLIMNDLPGYIAIPIIRPSSEVGAGDLEMRLTETPQRNVKVGLDNHGSLVTGQNRVRVDLENTRNLVFGDSIRVSGMVTDGSTNFVSAAYGLPIMARGGRLELSALQSSYELGGVLKSSNFEGKSTIFGAQATYPLVRTRVANLTISAAYQNRSFTNDRGLIEKYVIDALPLGFTFDWRDNFNGGAVTYGDIFYTNAHVAKDNSINPTRDKNYSKFGLNIARIQQLTKDIQGSFRYSGQFSKDNIDATDFISLAGPLGVRSYPVGEFSGHEGWIAQAELAYSVPNTNYAPYIFYDKGSSENRTTTLSRTLSGKGFGLRYTKSDMTIDVSASWSVEGGTSQAERESKSPRLWASLNVRF